MRARAENDARNEHFHASLLAGYFERLTAEVHMARRATIATLVLLMAGARLAPAADAQSARIPARVDARIGTFDLHFDEPSPARLREQERLRAATNPSADATSYDLKAQTFDAFVPPTYRTGKKAFGLLVWIAANARAADEIPPDWSAVLTRDQCIFICARDSGNGKPRDLRRGLALDAAYNVRRLYDIDPQRVYVGGFSNGANMAADVIRYFPRQFSGVVCMMRTDFYLHWTDDEHRYPTVSWQGIRNTPIDQAAKQLRLALVTGTMDRELMKTEYDCFRLDGFQFVSYFDVPNIGHGVAGGAWLEKALVALDRGRGAGPDAGEEPPDPREDVPPSTHDPNATRALPARDPAAQAQRLLNTARRYETNGMYEAAAPFCQRILKDYPDTPAAKEATFMLDRARHIKATSLGHLIEMGKASTGALFDARVAIAAGMHDAARLYLDRVGAVADNNARELSEAKAWQDWLDHNKQAARAKPADPALRAAILYRTGTMVQKAKPALAKEYYHRVLQEYPTTPAAESARKALAQMARDNVS
jgi:hypothetical protein